jgi:FHA domain
MNCPYCHKQNHVGAVLCEECGRKLRAASEISRFGTRELVTFQSNWAGDGVEGHRSGTGYLHQSAYLTLELLDTNRKIYLQTQGHISFGRADPETNWKPTIDLTPYGAIERGVSRAHADLYFESDQVFILELGSANGTRINGQPVQTGETHQVRNGDVIELGRLRVQVNFSQPTPESAAS